mgnify:CR=1 FL=1
MIPVLTLYQVSLTDIAKSCLLLRVRNNEIEHGKTRRGGWADLRRGHLATFLVLFVYVRRRTLSRF